MQLWCGSWCWKGAFWAFGCPPLLQPRSEILAKTPKNSYQSGWMKSESRDPTSGSHQHPQDNFLGFLRSCRKSGLPVHSERNGWNKLRFPGAMPKLRNKQNKPWFRLDRKENRKLWLASHFCKSFFSRHACLGKTGEFWWFWHLGTKKGANFRMTATVVRFCFSFFQVLSAFLLLCFCLFCTFYYSEKLYSEGKGILGLSYC